MEEEIRMATTQPGDGASAEGESVVNKTKIPGKRGRGRPQGSKKLKVCVTEVNVMELVSGFSNGGSTQPQRGRGRPKLLSTKPTVQEESGDDADKPVQRSKGGPKESMKEASNEEDSTTDPSPKKRGRPKKSPSKSPSVTEAEEDLENGSGDSDAPKMKIKSESEEVGEGNSAKTGKRGRPKGSPNKKPRLLSELTTEGQPETDLPQRGRGRHRNVGVNYTGTLTRDASNGISNTPQRRRGRPRKSIEKRSPDDEESDSEGSPPSKRGRGRPKGSLNKKVLKVHGEVSQPKKAKRGRPTQQPVKKGRPRKYPLPSPEEMNKPKVWKPLGRPRKYPLVDPPEGALPAPRRHRGRPRKSESKKGAHLRKNVPPSPREPIDGSQRKRGRPSSAAKSEEVSPKKRGRPKGSPNKSKARRESQQSDSAAVGSDEYGEPAEEEMEQDTQTMATEHGDDTDKKPVEQDANLDDSNQA